MSQLKDPYKVLGVAKSATATEIKKNYRKLARELHPDRGGDPEKLKVANAAYAILGDDKKRSLYDEFGHQAFRPGFDAETTRRFSNFGGAGGRSSGGGGIDVEELLKMFGGGGSSGFSGFGGRGRGPQRGADHQAHLTVSLAEALRGGERSLLLKGRSVTVRIPKGVRSGQRLRVSGKGEPGIDGGPPGDLFLEVTVQDHPLVRVERDDLEMALPITFAESIRGGSISVGTPTGTVKVKLPAGAEAGTRLRLKGQGLPRGGRGTRQGDLYLVLMPTPPTDSGADLTEALDILDEAYEEDVRAALKFD